MIVAEHTASGKISSNIVDRCLPSLCSARFFPHLSLPQRDTHDIDADDNSFDLLTGEILVNSGVQTYQSSIPLEGDTDDEEEQPQSQLPTILKVAFNDEDQESLDQEYSVYYELLRSGLFKLDFFKTYNVMEPLPSISVYPDAIAWPYGLFEETGVDGSSREENPVILVLPSVGPSLADRRQETHDPLSSRAKAALIRTLEKVHQAGYIHGNINANTIHIAAQTGIAVFTDFSLAKECEDEDVKQKEMETLLEVLAVGGQCAKCRGVVA